MRCSSTNAWTWSPCIIHVVFATGLLFLAAAAAAHNVTAGDREFVESIKGPAIIPFLYLGAKHMVTGYDHVLFLVGVVFYLYHLRDIFIYVSIFTVGHSITLLSGVLLGFGGNAYLIDAVIGLSVVYKGVENLGGFNRLGLAIDTKWAIFVFGLFHGMGLATKLMDLSIAPNGLLVNLIAFNVGVEVGQLLVLMVVVTWLNSWRRSTNFDAGGRYANVFLVISGLGLAGYHVAGYFGS